MADGIAFIDGEYLPATEAKISIFDIGFSRGDAVYDTVSVWKRHFFRLDDHVARFLRSCAGMRLRCPHPPDDLKRILARCVDRAGLDDALQPLGQEEGVEAAEDAREPHPVDGDLEEHAQGQERRGPTHLAHRSDDHRFRHPALDASSVRGPDATPRWTPS